MDTSNYGDDSGPGERKAAEYVATLLDEVGIESRLYESAPGRTSLVAHWGGSEGDPLLLHGHLDVVPAAAEDWQLDPFAGEIRDGYLWGRGTVDMKDFDAMLLAVVRHRQRTGRVPERPVRLVLHRRRGGRRSFRGAVPGRAAPGGARGLHRGRRRGRRLQRHRARSPALPDRGGREGHGLDAADRPGHGRPRLDDQPGQRRVAGSPRRWRASARTSGRSGSRRPWRCCWRRSPTWPAPRSPPTTSTTWSQSSAAPPGCSARSSATPSSRRCCRPATR